MIKINLLPPHILEGRRVKIIAVLMGLLLVATLVIMMAIVWAPAPFSLTSKVKASKEALAEAQAKSDEVDKIKQQVDATNGSFAQKLGWVDFVDAADRYPQKWIRWFQRINRWLPDELVINSLPLPNNNVLTLQGSTSDHRAANRLWHNLMRCDLLDPAAAPGVTVNPITPGPSGGANPRMAYPVTITMTLNPAYLQFLTVERPTVPASMGAGTTRAASGGARMGRGPSGASGSATGGQTAGRGRQGGTGGPGGGPGGR